MDFEPIPGVTGAQVIINLADGTRWTYDLNAAGAKVAFDGGHDLALRDMELGPVFLPEIPRVWTQPQIAFAFPLTAKGDPSGVRLTPVQVVMTRTPPPGGAIPAAGGGGSPSAATPGGASGGPGSRTGPPDDAHDFHHDSAGRYWAQDRAGRWWMQPRDGHPWYPSFPDSLPGGSEPCQ